jgi:hypothetical protein
MNVDVYAQMVAMGVVLFLALDSTVCKETGKVKATVFYGKKASGWKIWTYEMA